MCFIMQSKKRGEGSLRGMTSFCLCFCVVFVENLTAVVTSEDNV